MFGQGFMYTERGGVWSGVSCIQREMVFGQGFMYTERGGVWPWFHVYRQSEEKERVNNTTEMMGSYRSNCL